VAFIQACRRGKETIFSPACSSRHNVDWSFFTRLRGAFCACCSTSRRWGGGGAALCVRFARQRALSIFLSGGCSIRGEFVLHALQFGAESSGRGRNSPARRGEQERRKSAFVCRASYSRIERGPFRRRRFLGDPVAAHCWRTISGHWADNLRYFAAVGASSVIGFDLQAASVAPGFGRRSSLSTNFLAFFRRDRFGCSAGRALSPRRKLSFRPRLNCKRARWHQPCRARGWGARVDDFAAWRVVGEFGPRLR